MHRDGHTLWARVSVTPLEGAADSPCTVLHVADVTPLRMVETRLREVAHHDPLTGLPDRSRAVERLRDLLTDHATGADRVSPTGVAVVDLDNFRRVNDSLGHDVGDQLLVEVGRRLRRLTAAGDLVARVGGDEFAVVHRGGSPPADDFTASAERVLDDLRRPIRIGHRDIVVSASLGIAVDTTATVGTQDLLRYADAALLRAKRCGGARFVFCDHRLREAVQDWLDLELQLRSALEHDELALHYQPLVDRDGSVVSVEALVRWRHPQRGMLPPTAFLQVSEPSDLSAALDRWVLHNAATQLARWRARFPSLPLTVAVNVSPAHLLRDDCAANLSRALADTGVPPGDVCVEIPERQLVGVEPAHDGDHLDRLRDLGVRLALDDFGVGCFGLGHLARLPTEVLKIDHSLVEGLGRDEAASSILGAVVTMAHATGRTCVAEGGRDRAPVAGTRRARLRPAAGLLLRPSPARGAGHPPARSRWPAAGRPVGWPLTLLWSGRGPDGDDDRRRSRTNLPARPTVVATGQPHEDGVAHRRRP